MNCIRNDFRRDFARVTRLDLVDWPPRVSRSELFSFLLSFFFYQSSTFISENRDAVLETMTVRKRVISERVSISETTISEIKLKLRAGFIFQDDRIYVILSTYF